MTKKRKDTFVFRVAWQEVLLGYPPEVRLEVYDAIVEYVASGTPPQLKPLANMAFSFIRRDIDSDNRRYDEVVSKKREAGRKGMASRWGKNGNKDNTCYHQLSDVTEVTDVTPITDNDNVYDSDVILKEEKENKEERQPAVRYIPDPTIQECYEELVSSEIWAEDVIREKRRLGISLNLQQLRQMVEVFFGELKCRGTPPRSVQATKEHFSNWLNTYYEKQKKNELYKPNHTSKQDATQYAVAVLAQGSKSRGKNLAAEVERPF